jgi:hypothetical protein
MQVPVGAVAVVALGAVAGCAGSVGFDPGLEDLMIRGVAPATIVPGTRLVVTGASFVDEPWGAATLRLQGTAGDRAVDAAWPARFVDFATLGVAVDGGRLAEIVALGGDADFHGTATVEVAASTDHATYRSAPLAVDLEFRTQLTPVLLAVATGVIFVNDEIAIEGDGFLLGGEEGTTFARVSGCFTPEAGGDCALLPAVDMPVTPSAPVSRTRASFPFSPRIAGIAPGSFTGTLTLINSQLAAGPMNDGSLVNANTIATAGSAKALANRQAIAVPVRAAWFADQQGMAGPASAGPVNVTYQLVAPEVFSVDPPAASLGQFVFVRGGGFVGGEPGALTELELTGTLRKAGGTQASVQLTWIPELVDGRLVRYVLNTDDALGHALDLRNETGELTGSVTPVVSYGSARVRGRPRPVSFAIAPVKQVVVLDFETSYTEGLRDFGLRAVDGRIRDRILAVCREAYQGVNIEFRTAAPTDFALFETVEMVGVDPNDQGLFGYDNSPGKDSGNLRLYDRLGGVNAQIQEDGYPGFGGVFVRSLMGFSMHPGPFTRSVAGADPVFDELFDPFRPDRGGEPISSSDLAGGLRSLVDGSGCPGQSRAQQIQCAIFVLGNLVGGTVAHEVGHSLGLANPYQDGFHDPGDSPNRLMDAGEARPFLERAHLMGQGPAVFCDDEYAYLRRILPSPPPASLPARPSCR